jgi:type I restriction enzyme, S subunit
MIEGIRIPGHWTWAAFSDVARVASDLVDPILTPHAVHIAPNHIVSTTGKLLPFATVASDKITSAKHRFHSGQILYSKIRPYLAKAVLVSFEGLCSADMYPLDALIDSKFLLHWLLSPWFTAKASQNQGRTILPKINQIALGRLPVPIPPHREQTRIGVRIDELFSDLDAGVAALERAKANLKRYRAAVLKAAVEGKLTEAWRAEHPNTEPASKLLERILAERRKKWEADQLAKFAAAGKEPTKDWAQRYVELLPQNTAGLPELPLGWLWTFLGQLKDFSMYGPRFSSNAYSDSGVLVLRTTDFSDDGRINFETPPKLSLDEKTFLKYELKPKDLLITRTGSLGTLAVFQGGPKSIAGAFLIYYRLPLKECSTQYLYYFLKSPSGQKMLIGRGAGVGRPNLNMPAIDSIPISFPPFEEQIEINSEIAEKLSQIEATEKEITHALVRASRLRQSILKHAFEGKLVPQDPNDEPASVLLERLRASQTSHDANGKAATSARTRGRRAKSKHVEGRADQ